MKVRAARRKGRAVTGRVDLVGGGPGPADLMTVRAHRLLAAADVVVADRLGPTAEVLRELDPRVQVIDVGKRPGHHTATQDEINRLIVDHALAGRRVVRLKGGDPFVFGRGGEEMRACIAAGVPVEVTPGVSSVISVPQAAGIPVTHRGTASAFHVVNGQGIVNEQGVVTESTLAALSDPTVTTVVLMGVTALPRIAAAALRHGIPSQRPVAFVESGHTPRQRVTRTQLGEAAETARAIGLSNPAVIVIGEVARAGLLVAEPALPAHEPLEPHEPLETLRALA